MTSIFLFSDAAGAILYNVLATIPEDADPEVRTEFIMKAAHDHHDASRLLMESASWSEREWQAFHRRMQG